MAKAGLSEKEKLGEKEKAIFVGLSVKDTENRLTIVVLGPCQNVTILYLFSTRMNLRAFSISPIFFLLLLAGEATSSVSLDLQWYENYEEEKLQCNDGSPGGFYYRPSTDTAGENKWIFYLQGGGWCWNSTSCADRIDRNGNGHLVSSSQ